MRIKSIGVCAERLACRTWDMKDQVLRQNGKCHKGYFSVSCLFAAFFTTLMATVKKEDLKYMEQSHKTTQAKLRISQTFHPNWRDYILMIVLVCLYWKTHSSSWEGHLIQQTKGLAKKLSGSSSEILLLRKPCTLAPTLSPWKI